MLTITCSNGRDMFADARCTCPWVDRWTGKESADLRHRVEITGYNDANFWGLYNGKPQQRACKCGRRYEFTWTLGGVKFEWLDGPVHVRAPRDSEVKP